MLLRRPGSISPEQYALERLPPVRVANRLRQALDKRL